MRLTALLTAAAVVFGSTVAFAQPPQTQSTAQAVARPNWRQMHAERRQEMMSDLHIVLRIRPEQESAFQTFMASLQDRPHDRSDRMQQMQSEQSLTTPQLIDRMDARKVARDAEARQRGDAAKRFYAALSPEQQQVFDALHRLAMDHHGGWGGHMHGGHGGMDQHAMTGPQG